MNNLFSEINGKGIMKKSVLLLILFILAFSITSCATVNKRLALSDEQQSIESVEIYNVIKQYYEGNISSFRSENAPIYTLSAEQISDFTEELLQLKFEEKNVFFPIPTDGGYDYSGYVVCVVYDDGGYDIFAEEGQFLYSVQGDDVRYTYGYADYCGDVPWTDFIERYIEN